MNTPFEHRPGFALPVALLAMMVIGAIVTGGFYASSQESRISSSSDLAAQAFFVAEYGLGEAFGALTNEDLTQVDTAKHYPPVDVTFGGDELGQYSWTVRRLSDQLFLVHSMGEAAAGPRTASREVGSVLRITTAEMPYPSALAVFGGVTAAGNSEIRGDDAGGPGCSAGNAVAGVTAMDENLVDEQGKTGKISGDPPVAEEPALDTASLNNFGSVQLQDLIDRATKIYEGEDESENGMGPQTYIDEDGNEVCDTSVKSNWGDPDDDGPCAEEMPIIYAKGDLRLSTGSGQGILIVDGDLRATGNFDFYGVVIVRGSLFTAGTGNHLEGSVIVRGDGELDSESTTTGNSLVQYSQCRVQRAFNASVRPARLSSRSWIDLSALARGTS